MLLNHLFIGITRCLKRPEDVLGDPCLCWRSRSPEELGVAVEPFVNLLVDGMVLIAYLLRSQLLFYGLGLGGCAVLVGAADEDGVVAHEPAKSGMDVS